MTLPFLLRNPPDIEAVNYDFGTNVKRDEFLISDLFIIELDSLNLKKHLRHITESLKTN